MKSGNNQRQRAPSLTVEADGYWKLPEMPYLPHLAMKWLLSDRVRKLSTTAHSGYRFLCDHAAIQKPIGVLTTDEEKLREYSRLTFREWDRSRVQILDNFETYIGPNGEETYHHEFQKGLYRAFCENAYEKAKQAHASASVRWVKSGLTASKMPPYADPYRSYAKKVSNKLTTLPLPPPLTEGAGGAEIADGESPADPPAERLGSHLKKFLHRPPAPPSPPAPEPVGGA